jgi:hypothetical protein
VFGFLTAEVLAAPLFPAGLGLSLLLFFWLGFSAWMHRRDKRPANRPAMALYVPLGLLALCFALFDTPWLRAVNLLVFLMLALTQQLLAAGLSVYDWSRPRFLGDLLRDMFVLPFVHIGKPPGALAGTTKSAGWKTAFKVLLGFLIALPALALVGFLLCLSDKGFSDLVVGILNTVFSVAVWPHVGNLFWGLALGWLLYSLLWGVRHGQDGRTVKPQEIPPAPDGKAPAAAALGALIPFAAIYALFLGLQFSYLFAGAPPTDMTFAEYARSGFFELFAVTLLNLAAVLATLQLCRVRDSRQGLVLRVVCTIVTGQTALMLASAVQRMALYVEYYGMTTLRVVVLLCEAGVAVLLFALLLKLWRPGFRFFRWLACASIALVLVCNYLNVDALVARWNITAVREGRLNADIEYLASAPAALGVLFRMDEPLGDMLQTSDGPRAAYRRIQTAQRDWRCWTLEDALAWAAQENDR